MRWRGGLVIDARLHAGHSCFNRPFKKLMAWAALEQRLATPYIAFTISRSLNFCSFPVEVFGISANKMWRGHL